MAWRLHHAHAVDLLEHLLAAAVEYPDHQLDLKELL